MLDIVDTEQRYLVSVSPFDDQMLRDWLTSEAVVAYLRGASPSVLIDDSDAISVDDLNDIDDLMFPPRCILTPPSPDLHERNASDSSAMSTSSDIDLETPFEDLSYQYATYSSARYERTRLSPHDEVEEDGERSFWSSVIKPVWSKDTREPKNVTVFGHTHRVQLPARRRRRSSSTSSTSTAYTKTSSGPKSILTRTPSDTMSTLTNSPKRKSPPSIKSVKSVKFVDEPVVYPERLGRSSPMPPPPSPLRSSQGRESPGMVNRLRRSLSKTQLPSPHERPVISGPFPLWEAPIPADRVSCRSSSRSSIRSTRSSSRLRTLWDRVTAAVR